ncbi:MAG: NADPH-dependent oxidoreductase [Anaerolineae bacterium]|nr:NADPH-dependent oxidoreductase [Anaerolineae bacterium]
MTIEREEYTSPVSASLNKRVSIRHFTGEAIPDEMLRAILNSARRTSTSSNMQAYSLVVVRNPETKKQLAVLAGNQKHIETSAVFIAICADIHRLEIAADMHGKTIAKNLENFLVSSVDAALLGQSVLAVAESFGLGGVMIGGMRNHPKEAAELLGFPKGVYIVFGMSLGFPDEAKRSPQKPRLPEELIIHYEQYDTSDPTEKLRQHDAELAEHYRSQGRGLDDAAWTGVIANRFSTIRRPEMRSVLEELGFNFD